MADYPVEAKAGNKSLSYRASQVLVAGETIADVSGVYTKGGEVVNGSLPITSINALTVPAGKWASVSVKINIEVLDSDPNA